MSDRPATLEYPNAPIAGNVVRHRSDGRLTLTVLRTPTLLVRGIVLILAGATLVIGMVALWSSMRTWIVYMGVGGIALVVSGAGLLIVGLHPTTFDLDDRRLRATSRGVFEIKRFEWERLWIADLRVVRLPFTDTLTRPFALRLILRDGQEADLYAGSRADAAFLSDALRDALKLPPERWLEDGFPPRPRWSNVARRINLTGVVFEFKRPRVHWASLVGLLPVLGAGSIVAASAVLQRWDFVLTPSAWNAWTLGWAAMYLVLATVAVQAMIYPLRTHGTLALDEERLILRERGIRPCDEEWPAKAIAEVRRPGRGDLQLVLVDGSTHLLLSGLRPRDAEWVAQSLLVALRRFHSRMSDSVV